MEDKPTLQRTYQHLFFDSSRWSRFKFRSGDIVVCTSYKAGTTWTQMICALLVHGTPNLPKPLNTLSPWLDSRLASIDDVIANYEAQSFRRIIKTHTPFDGIPFDERVDYVICGRDPRDVFMSTQNHADNSNIERIIEIRRAQGDIVRPPPALPKDLNARFNVWMTTPTLDGELDGAPFWSHFRHAESFWKCRSLANLHFLHYADLKADLGGQMRRLARELKTDVHANEWSSLENAATFAAMKANADATAPLADRGVWLSNEQFFNKGENEQWRGALSDESLDLYQRLSRERYEPGLLAWLERGSLKQGYPSGQ